MKNMFKKAIAAASAAVLCAVPMISTSASAATIKNTYRVYFDIKKGGNVPHETQIELGSWTGTTKFIGATEGGDNNYDGLGNLKFVGGTGAVGYSKGVVNYYFNESILNNTNYTPADGQRTLFEASFTTTASDASKIDIKCKCSNIELQYVLVGDVNNDNSVDISDAVRIYQLFPEDSYVKANDSLQHRAADVNNDGIINEDDVILLQRHIACFADAADFGSCGVQSIADFK